ncbi:hypothetical protein HanRHA438_Chr05g0235811 [Helianthus annuus]|uniref:Transmembrane protein n=1 Tax=Helianthus annuus TaxID=4232 RepID=A0A9K3J161_HELAN|nr:uncharacterized protein LOC110941598 [Helianthus annuus]KAF5806878.1 hypothetical protein HanXRQr2_Chr05g0226741 [Helianthus annuus]KAJ0919978.1 hypothetical protein HanRHA438_Chr05g0235811 [Helianthus annuus]KAJ0923669.1 hypothetical protein HanPSC8_Chr05g0218781 [Helianthus annuus]
MKMSVRILLILCTQLLAISLHHHVIHSKGLTLQLLQGVERVGVDGGNTVQVNHELKIGKGPYGGANMNRDPRVSKSNAPSSHLRHVVCICVSVGIGVGFVTPLLFGF